MGRRTIFGAAIVAATLWWPGAAQSQDLALTVEVPAEQVADWPFDVTTSWRTDAPRVLSVALLRATECGDNLDAGLELDPAGLVLIDETVDSSGSRIDEATLVTVGNYTACAYLQPSSDPAAPADLIAQAPIEITTFPGTEPSPPTAGIACGDIGGPRRITRVRAFAIRCPAARRVARRWGRADERATIGDYRCRTRGRKVICRASKARKVTFRFR